MAATETEKGSERSEKVEKSSSKNAPKKEVGVLSAVLAFPRFLQDAWQELKKVHRPSRQETVQATMVVLAMVVTVAAFLGSVDFFLGWFMHWATIEAFS